VAYGNSSRLFLVSSVIITALFSPSVIGIRGADASGIIDSPAATIHADSQRSEHQNNGSSVSSYLILLKEKPSSDDVASVESHQGRVSRIYELVDAMAVALPDRMVNALVENNPRIKSIEPDVAVFATDINLDTQIGADQIWASTTYASGTASGVPIAVLDTGIDHTHPEFTGRIQLCRSEILNADGICNDENGHGTHVAGIASAKGVNNLAKGVAPDSVLYINQVLDSTGTGSISGIIAGIEWSVANNAKIVSMSLSTGWTTVSANCDSNFPTLAAAINNAVSAGVTVVSAAGNSGSNGVGAPGCISSSIAVGAVDSSDTIASFSGRGSAMADHGIVAPGVKIYSSYKGGTYATASGTSMATPAVAGAIALMFGVDPSVTPQEIKSSLFQNSCKQTTTPSCSAITTVPSSTYGSGRVDSYASTTAIGALSESNSDFSLTTSTGTITIAKGKSGTLTISVSSLNSFTSSNIALAASSSPLISGTKYSFSPTASLNISEGETESSVLTISIPKNASPGKYTLTITATGAADGSGNDGELTSLTHSTQVTLNVVKR
jgi:subtilisin family serine protease